MIKTNAQLYFQLFLAHSNNFIFRLKIKMKIFFYIKLFLLISNSFADEESKLYKKEILIREAHFYLTFWLYINIIIHKKSLHLNISVHGNLFAIGGYSPQFAFLSSAPDVVDLNKDHSGPGDCATPAIFPYGNDIRVTLFFFFLNLIIILLNSVLEISNDIWSR